MERFIPYEKLRSADLHIKCMESKMYLSTLTFIDSEATFH